MKNLLLLFKDQAFRRKTVTLLVMLVAILGVMTASALTLTSTPVFCGLCHEMGADHASWQQSAHKNVSCIACHTPPNLIGFVQHKMAALPELYLHLADRYEKPINKESKVAEELGSENCGLCHKMVNRRSTPSTGIIINHVAHIKKEINCTTCHNRVAHPGLKEYKNFMKMGACYRCHGLDAKAKAPGKCSTCHPKDFDLKPVNHKSADWLPPKHSKAAKQERKNCQMCHQETFCSNCHGMQMPHPADNWTKGAKQHTAIGKANPASCTKCHRQQDFCSTCHHKGYDPGKGAWIQFHPSQVKEKGAESCFECHGPTYCAYCHVRGERPASVKGPASALAP